MRKKGQESTAKISLLERIERADQKIDDFQHVVRDGSSYRVGSNSDLDARAQEVLNTHIDEIVIEIWNCLTLAIDFLHTAEPTGTQTPTLWNPDAMAPSVIYGPENVSASHIIEALAPHFSNEGFRDAINSLVVISDKNRDLRMCSFRLPTRAMGETMYPNTESPILGFVVNLNTEVQQALFKGPVASLSEANPVINFLADINSGIRTYVESL